MNSQKLLLKFLESRFSLHAFFWISFFSVWLSLIAVSQNFWEKLPIGILVGLYYLTACYTGRALIKHWQSRNVFLRFILLWIGCIVTLSVSGAVGIGLIFKRDVLENSFLENLLVCTPIVILFMTFGMFLTAARSSVLNQIQSARLAEHHKEQELAFLRSQLSPHFLFNTLNNLYGLALTQPTTLAPLILRLSDLLRYSIYETNQTFVSLNDELNYIKNYIGLESIRLGERLVLNVTLDSREIRIAPMLLVTFIENAFKHAKNTADDKIWIEMHLYFRDDDLVFRIKNSFSTIDQDTSEANAGVGLVNASKRLQLLYPGTHTLKHHKDNGFYFLELTIRINA